MSNLMSNYSPLDVTFTKGSGCWLTDTSGKKYFDALSGLVWLILVIAILKSLKAL